MVVIDLTIVVCMNIVIKLKPEHRDRNDGATRDFRANQRELIRSGVKDGARHESDNIYLIETS